MTGRSIGCRAVVATGVVLAGLAWCGVAGAEGYGAELACTAMQQEGQYVCEAVVTRLDTAEPVMAPRIHARLGEEARAFSTFSGAEGERRVQVVVTVGDGGIEARIDVHAGDEVLFDSKLSLSVN
jgi:hypothetical protein